MALDAAGMVTWEWDLRSDVIRYSDNVASLAAGETIEPYESSAGLLKTVHPDDRDALARAIGRTLNHNASYECEYRVLMQDGHYHWIRGQGKKVVLEEGKPVRIFGVSQEITARKRLEEELQARSRQLAELAARLTMTEHRERRRLADLLHEELQQILIGARMQLQTLGSRERGVRRRNILRVDQVLEQGQSVARSITRTLDPPMSLRKELPLALQWLANDMRDRHGLKVAVRVPESVGLLPEPIAVLVFTGAREMLLNIVKHAGTRRGHLRLRRRASSIEIEIRDQGVGVDARVLQTPGSDRGLGLFSIRERAELLGGSLTVDTSRRNGARFILSLPVPADAPASRRPSRHDA
jgi:signal transduction histidine kinase